MNANFDRDELLRLLDRLVVGTLEAEDRDWLENILVKHPEARKEYFAFMDVDMGLREMAAGRAAQVPPLVGLGFGGAADENSPASSPATPFAGPSGQSRWTAGTFSSALHMAPPESQPSARPKPPVRFFGHGVTAAVAALATATVLLLAMHPSDKPEEIQRPLEPVHVASRNQTPMDHVATLLFADECRWKSAAAAPVEGERLATGELHLGDGLALLRFDGGAIAVITGNTKVDLESRGSVRLHYGHLTARASEEAVGFTVRTPANDVIDLGTEFAVKVEQNGATEVHVLDGTVEYRDPAKRQGSGQLLRSGQAVRFDKAHTQKPLLMAVNAKSLDQILREAKPKPREDLLAVYEGFQYNVGALPLANADGGWGWRGPWRRRRANERGDREKESTEDLQIAFQKLHVPWPIRGGRAGMLEMPPGNRFLVRPLAETVDLAKDRVYYISMMMREELNAAVTGKPRRHGTARLTLRSSEDYWGERVCFGLPDSRKPHIELADFIRFTGAEIPFGQSLIWVAKIAARSQGEDEIFFRVYQEGESLDIFEPADWSVTSRRVQSDSRLDVLLLTSTGKTRRWFDELRIGTSWRAVVPIARTTTIGSDQTTEKMKEWERSSSLINVDDPPDGRSELNERRSAEISVPEFL